MRSVPNAAVMFVTFEVVSKWLLKKQMQPYKTGVVVDNVIETKVSKKSRRPLAMISPVNFKTASLSSPIISLRL